MANWTQRPLDFPLQFNPYQDAFWRACKARLCNGCHIEFPAESSNACPQCGVNGIRKFHRLTLIAGRRGGKTRAASIATVQEAMIPNSIIWACAPTVPKLHRYVIPSMGQLIPKDWVVSWNAEFGDLRLKNGSLIHYQTLEHPDQGRGQGLSFLWIDEVSELGEEHWDVIRPSLAERRGAAIFSTSPRSFDWVHDKLYKPAEDGYVIKSDGSVVPVAGFWACRYATAENPIISLDELAEAKATMSAKMYQQEFEADFVTFQGAVYGDELSASHILSTDEEVRAYIPEWPNIDPNRPVLIGIDTGADHPFGAVKLVSTERGLIVTGEYLERERSFIKHAAFLKQMAGIERPKWAINKNDKQAAIELAQHGIYAAKAENDVVAGTERVKSWMNSGQLKFVAARVPLTIRQMQAYRWADNTAADGQKRLEKVFKKHDELPDAIRYALMSWPLLPKPPEPTEAKRDLSHLGEYERSLIERLRSIESKAEQPEPDTVSENFWN
jgi:hypothetical protein